MTPLISNNSIHTTTTKHIYSQYHNTVDGRNPANQLRLVVNIPSFTRSKRWLALGISGCHQQCRIPKKTGFACKVICRLATASEDICGSQHTSCWKDAAIAMAIGRGIQLLVDDSDIHPEQPPFGMLKESRK